MRAVSFENVSFKYFGSKVEVLENVDFHINYGEITLLSGLSGKGKSTALYLINGAIPHVFPGKLSGKITVADKDISKMSMGEISHLVGSVLQNADSQIIHTLVEDEIAFGCENFSMDEKTIEENIETSCKLMQLDKSWQTRKLSGGQKQRLITATTLAMKQKILVLDEPLANLDKEGVSILMTTLKELAEKGYAILLVEHRVNMIIDYIDSAFDIEDRKIKKIEDKKGFYLNHTDIIKYDSPLTTDFQKHFILDGVGFETFCFKTKKREILKNIDLTIDKSERVVLLGQNGCGKTTLVKTISKLQKQSYGKITQYVDIKIKRAKPKWFKKVGYVYQNPNYQLFMSTVEKEIFFNAHSKEYANKIIELFEIRDILDRHPHSLSEGQKRKISIAAVMATKPEVLILDEPTVGQDFYGLKKLVEIINKIHQETKCTIITITHDVRCAEALCDKAVIMEAGEIKEVGDKSLVNNYLLKN